VRVSPAQLSAARQDVFYLYGEDVDALFEAAERLLHEGGADAYRLDVSELGRIELQTKHQDLFGGRRRHVLVRNAESANSKQAALLQDYAARTWVDARIIICAPLIEARKALHKHLVALEAVAHCCFYKPSAGEFRRWLDQEIGALGLNMDEPVRAYLAESLHGLRRATTGALQRLALYDGGQGGQLGLAQVAALIGESAPEDIERYCDAVCARSNQAIQIVRRLLRDAGSSEIQILTWLQNRITQMLMYKWFAAAGRKDAAGRARLFGAARKRLPAQAERWRSSELIAAVGRIAEAEVLLKGASVEAGGLVLERLTLALLGAFDPVEAEA